MRVTKKVVLWTAGILLVPALAIIGWSYAALSDDGRDTASVLRVIDGDTIDVDLDGEETRVRLLNIDTPETKHPDEAVQCLGPEASDFLEELLPTGTEVQLEYDVEREDHYGRTLAGVFHEDSLVNSQIATQGLGVAVVYEPNRKFYDQVKAAEHNARNHQAGIFDPEVDCALPQQLTNLQDNIDQAPEDLPSDVAGVEESLETLAPLQTQVDEYLSLLAELSDNDGPRFLALVYADRLDDFENQLASHQSALQERETALTEHKTELEAEAERKREEEERQRAEEERQEAAAEAERQRQQEAAEEQQQQQEAERQRRQQVEPDRGQTPDVQEQRSETSGSSGSSGSSSGSSSNSRSSNDSSGGSGSSGSSGSGAPSGYGTDADYPGYTGPRCYAPGGQYWRPC